MIGRAVFGLALLLLAAQPARAQMPMWAVESDSSILTFEGASEGSPFEGKFGKWRAEISFDPARLADSQVTVTIDTGSLDTGYDERDDIARGKGWFDVKTWPEAKFVTDGITAKDDTHYEAVARLTIGPVTRQIKLPFTLSFSPQADGTVVARMTAETVLRRLDFELGAGDWADTSYVADEVVVRISLVARSMLPVGK